MRGDAGELNGFDRVTKSRHTSFVIGLLIIRHGTINLRFIDVSILCQFATWTFRYHLRRFATWTVRHLDVSHLLTFRFQDVSLPLWTFCHLSKVCSGGEKARKVAKHPKVQIIQVANRSGSETSRWRTRKVAKRPVTKFKVHSALLIYQICITSIQQNRLSSLV